jgi:hypothetical protein
MKKRGRTVNEQLLEEEIERRKRTKKVKKDQKKLKDQMKLDEIQKTKETLTNTLLTLNISPLVSDKISSRVVPENRSSLNHNILKHHSSYEEVMCKILDENFWTILTKEVNDTLVKLDSKNAKKYFKKKLTISDVKHLVGIHYKLD